MKRLPLIFVFITVMALLVAGNAPKVEAASASKSILPKTISIASWPIGTVSYDRAVATATIMQKYSGIRIILQPTSGMQWFEEVRVGNVAGGGANALDVAAAYHGIGLFEGVEPHNELRQFYCAGVTPASVYARPDRGIKTLADFRGKKVYGQSQRSTVVGIFVKHMLDYYRIRKGEITILPFSEPGDAAAGVIEGRADAYITALAGHITQARQAMKIVFVPVPKEVVDYVNSKTGSPFISAEATAVYEKTYGIPQGTPIWGWAQVECIHKDVGEETVYALIKALYDHGDELAAMGPVAAVVQLKVALLSPNVLPYHPGAIRYYKEKGMWTAELEATQQRLLAAEKKGKGKE